MSIVPVPTSIARFRDALGLALELSDEFAFAQAVAVVDADHRCIDFSVFTGIGDGLVPSVSWFSRRRSRHPSACRVLLLSIRSMDGILVAEADLAEFRFATATITRLGATLIDWIETDGELVRSYAYLTCPTSTWASQAQIEGAVDCSDWLDG